MSRLILFAPLAGWSAPLDEAPDAVFAQRMLGDGLVIDPTGHELCAPCDGEVISIAASRHAIAVRASDGAEILLHVGIDTVGLGGEGFTLHVAQGAKVRAGDRLLTFDLERLARGARSLVTPIILTNSDQFEIVSPQLNREVAVGDILFELRPVAGASAVAVSAASGSVSEVVTVKHEHGIHARPAALIANFSRGLPLELEVSAHGRTANPRSAVALMSLGIRGGDRVTLSGSGPDAAAALAGIRRIIDNLEPATKSAAVHTLPMPAGRSSDPTQLRGVIASRGFAVGKAFFLREAEIAVVEAGAGVAHESAELERARTEVRERLQQLSGTSATTAREIIAAHLEFVDDWELVAAARRAIAHGKSAAYAWRRAVRDSADALRALGDPRIAERVDDLLDLERQVLVALLGQTPTTHVEIPERAIVLAEDLKPSQFVSLDTQKLAGVCLAAGGPTSHVAILAAAVGVPMLVATGPTVLDVENETALILDAEQGSLRVAPDQQELSAAERAVAVRRQRIAAARSAAQNDCHTADGERIEVFANLGSLADAKFAVAQGAEGCGLLRTEFLFLERNEAPDEREQLHCYQQIADALAGRPLIIRTLDVGGDKPIPYLPLPAEENPALGLRGVRTSLWQPDLLRVQLRALLQVRPLGQCRVLLPMITDLDEIRTVRRLIDELRRDLGMTMAPALGAMIETPAAAVFADQLAREVDFLSIGTNDLTQYTLAMDRGHADLAARLDGLHPAVLRLIAMTAEAGAAQGRLVAMCGGLASDPFAVPVLLGLGIRELSVVPSMIPQLKQQIAALTLDTCRSLAQRALRQESAEAVRALLVESSHAAKVAL
ncbi:MAG TPA: phosphoenolpyruvate--protein phosphotransferase [Povalibacter sp.]|nr:phosphoenolpyruvate--protein phosphotransferase [Povalibacter sp.]